MVLMEVVSKLEGKTDEKRRDEILKILQANGYEYNLERYSYAGKNGINIILEVGRGEKEILLISHYDAFLGSPGANDNASAIAVSLDVYHKLIEYSKRGMLNTKVKVIFFGDEEPTLTHSQGRLGSRAYVEKHHEELQNMIAVYNLELCGIGNMLGIWPVTAENKDSLALEVLKKVADKLKVYYEEAGTLLGFFADYESFREAGIKDAFCLTAVPSEEKDLLREYVEKQSLQLIARNILALFIPKYEIPTPKLLQHYHNKEDKAIYLDETTLRMISDVTFNTIVNLDRKFRKKLERF